MRYILYIFLFSSGLNKSIYIVPSSLSLPPCWWGLRRYYIVHPVESSLPCRNRHFIHSFTFKTCSSASFFLELADDQSCPSPTPCHAHSHSINVSSHHELSKIYKPVDVFVPSKKKWALQSSSLLVLVHKTSRNDLNSRGHLLKFIQVTKKKNACQ